MVLRRDPLGMMFSLAMSSPISLKSSSSDSTSDAEPFVLLPFLADPRKRAPMREAKKIDISTSRHASSAKYAHTAASATPRQATLRIDTIYSCRSWRLSEVRKTGRSDPPQTERQTEALKLGFPPNTSRLGGENNLGTGLSMERGQTLADIMAEETSSRYCCCRRMTIVCPGRGGGKTNFFCGCLFLRLGRTTCSKRRQEERGEVSVMLMSGCRSAKMQHMRWHWLQR